MRKRCSGNENFSGNCVDHRHVRFWEIKGYLATAHELSALPRDRAQLTVLLDAYLLDKALYELTYELSSRPGWARIPLLGIQDILSGT